VDLILELGGKTYAIEIKAGRVLIVSLSDFLREVGP
jgi:predicted RecB family endonuclease